jgi:ATP-binding cassette subfamily F protein uup
LSFDGAVVVVTHDRAFLDRVCTGLLHFGPHGPTRYASRSQIPRPAPELPDEDKPRQRELPGTKKRSWKAQQEFEALPGRIEQAETEHAELAEVLADPDTYARPPVEVAALTTKLAELEVAIEVLYERWGELESQ